MASNDDKSSNVKQVDKPAEEFIDTLELAKKAIKCFEQLEFFQTIKLCHAIYKRNLKPLGNRHEYSLECQTIIGRLQILIREYAQAAKNLTYVYETRLRLYGPEDFRTLTTLRYLTKALIKQGKYRAISKLFNGLKNGDALKYKFAEILRKVGKFKPAIMFYKQVYKKRVKTLGKNHELTENCVFSVADILKKQGRYAEASLAYYEVNGGYLYQTAMAEDLIDKGKYEEALKIFQERYDRDSKIWGADEPETSLVDKEILAKVHLALNRADKCLQMYKEVLFSRNKSLVKFHNFAADTVEEYVKIFVQLKSVDKWMNFLRRNLEDVTTILGPDHVHSLWVLYCLGYALAYRNKYKESLTVFNSLSEKLVKKDPDNIKALKCQFPVICVHALLGNITRARELLVKLFRDFLRFVENKVRVPKSDTLMLHRLRELLNMCHDMSERDMKILGFCDKIIEIMDTQRQTFLNKSERP